MAREIIENQNIDGSLIPEYGFYKEETKYYIVKGIQLILADTLENRNVDIYLLSIDNGEEREFTLAQATSTGLFIICTDSTNAYLLEDSFTMTCEDVKKWASATITEHEKARCQ